MRIATLSGVGGMSGTGSDFTETVLRKAGESNGFAVVDDQTMSSTGLGDVAGIAPMVLGKGCGPGTHHTVNVHEILRQAGLPPDLVRPCTSDEFPTSAKRPSYSALENRKIRSVDFGGIRSWQDVLGAHLRAREEA